MSILLISLSFLLVTTPGTDDGFAQIKESVELDMENRCAESPDELCGFTVHFLNISHFLDIPANP